VQRAVRLIDEKPANSRAFLSVPQERERCRRRKSASAAAATPAATWTRPTRAARCAPLTSARSNAMCRLERQATLILRVFVTASFCIVSRSEPLT
jgi:hypothetical protein